MNIYEQITKNKHLTWIIVSVFVLFFVFLGAGFDYYMAGTGIPVFTIIALVFGFLSSFIAYWQGDRLVLMSTHAETLDESDSKQKQWQNVVEEMKIAAGIPLPKIYVINDPDPNAFATGRDPDHSSIAVTTGLLNKLNREELQAVAAHEMSHIKNFDIRLMLMISALVGSIALIADWARRALFYRDRGSSRKRGGNAAAVILIIWLVTVVLAPILSQLMAMFVSRKREYLADASGAELTRNPLALANALEKIDASVEPTRAINQGTAHLCICDPKGRPMGLKEGWSADLFATHPPIRKRIEALQQMSYLKNINRVSA